MKLLLRSALYVLVTTVFFGGLYPLAVTLAARAIWPDRANGSYVSRDGRAVGSSLLGQRFQRPEYLHPRPSAAGTNGYDALASGGRNLGPTDAKLARSIAEAVRQSRLYRPDRRPVPPDLVTASASGLDPHLSPDAAYWQAPRIAAARGVPEELVLELIRRHVEPRTLGILGEPRVNVLLTNLDLDRSLHRANR